MDKTGLISFINKTLGTSDKLSCVSRPRRFGKSFAAKMLCAYYDRSCDSRDLFRGLEIERDRDFETYLNKYDVIYLDITWFISIVKNIKDVVRYLEREVANELCEIYPKAGRKAESLPLILSEINRDTGNKFIVLIDEWDALFREASEDRDLQNEYIRLLRGLFKSSQTDKMIEAAYMTGILPIKKYGTQSAITDFREYSMVTPKRLAEYVGFTQAEVKCLCETHDMDFKEMRWWYDGYSFSRQKSVYNPNSVIEAIKNEEFESYWTRTETYESLRFYIDLDEDGLKEAIIRMLGGESCHIDAGMFQNDMTSIKSRDDVLTLLVHLGYLAYDPSKKRVFIPNEEIRQEFVRAVKGSRYTEVAKLIRSSEKLLEDTLNGDGDAVAERIEKVHRIVTTPLAYNSEDALRSTIRFAYLCCLEEFMEIQELPSGNGFADIAFLPKKGSDMPILLIEPKWNKSAEGAIAQIKDRKYPEVFEGYGSDILLVGVNYSEKSKKHSCEIERIQMGRV